MKAKPFMHRKRAYPNGDIMEMNYPAEAKEYQRRDNNTIFLEASFGVWTRGAIKAWYVPKTKDKPHGFKYSLAYIREGKRVIGYDNAERKGDHRHHEGKQYAYEFESIDKLINDFFTDVRRYKHES